MNKDTKDTVISELKLTREVLKTRIDDCLNNKESSTRDLDGLFERCDNIDTALKELIKHERILG